MSAQELVYGMNVVVYTAVTMMGAASAVLMVKLLGSLAHRR